MVTVPKRSKQNNYSFIADRPSVMARMMVGQVKELQLRIFVYLPLSNGAGRRGKAPLHPAITAISEDEPEVVTTSPELRIHSVCVDAPIIADHHGKSSLIRSLLKLITLSDSIRNDFFITRSFYTSNGPGILCRARACLRPGSVQVFGSVVLQSSRHGSDSTYFNYRFFTQQRLRCIHSFGGVLYSMIESLKKNSISG